MNDLLSVVMEVVMKTKTFIGNATKLYGGVLLFEGNDTKIKKEKQKNVDCCIY